MLPLLPLLPLLTPPLSARARHHVHLSMFSKTPHLTVHDTHVHDVQLLPSLASFNSRRRSPRDHIMAGKALLQQAMQVPAQYPHLNIFQAVDQDGGGEITADELSRALSSSFDEFDHKTCVMLMNMYDGDRSGSIGPGEFEQLWGFLEAWKRGTTARAVVVV